MQSHVKNCSYKCFITEKPSSLDEFLNSFVDEMNTLEANGLIVNDRQIAVNIRCFTCDTPARAFLKGNCEIN